MQIREYSMEAPGVWPSSISRQVRGGRKRGGLVWCRGKERRGGGEEEMGWGPDEEGDGRERRLNRGGKREKGLTEPEDAGPGATHAPQSTHADECAAAYRWLLGDAMCPCMPVLPCRVVSWIRCAGCARRRRILSGRW